MYTGLTGSLKLVHPEGTAVRDIAYISGWSIEDTTEVIESTRLDLTHREAWPGFQSWSASADGTVVFEGNGCHEDLFTAKHRGDKIELLLYLNDRAAVGFSGKSVCFKGGCYIESLSVNLFAEGKGNISIGVKGTGALELLIDGVNIKTQEPVWMPSFGIEIRDGHLFVAAPEGKNPFYVENGRLKVTL